MIIIKQLGTDFNKDSYSAQEKPENLEQRLSKSDSPLSEKLIIRVKPETYGCIEDIYADSAFESRASLSRQLIRKGLERVNCEGHECQICGDEASCSHSGKCGYTCAFCDRHSVSDIEEYIEEQRAGGADEFSMTLDQIRTAAAFAPENPEGSNAYCKLCDVELELDAVRKYSRIKEFSRAVCPRCQTRIQITLGDTK